MNFDEAVRSVVAGDHPDPFSFLGMHASEGGPVVRAFLPGAQAVEVVSPNGGSLGKLEHVHLGALRRSRRDPGNGGVLPAARYVGGGRGGRDREHLPLPRVGLDPTGPVRSARWWPGERTDAPLAMGRGPTRMLAR